MQEIMDTNVSSTIHVGLTELSASANKYVLNSKARNTIRAYQSDWRSFCTWCDERHLSSLPAEPKTVALYLSDMADRGYRTSTIGRHMISIGLAHRTKGFPSPTSDETVRAVWRGIRNTLGVAPQGNHLYSGRLATHVATRAKRPHGPAGPRTSADRVRRRIPTLGNRGSEC